MNVLRFGGFTVNCVAVSSSQSAQSLRQSHSNCRCLLLTRTVLIKGCRAPASVCFAQTEPLGRSWWDRKLQDGGRK